MVRRMLKVVYKEVNGLHQAAYVLALFAFGSQLLALVRDRMLAHEFGASSALDLYYTAFRIPDVLFVLFASTLSVYVLIPFVSQARQFGSDTAARQLLSEVFTLFLVVYTFCALCIWVAAPWLAPLLFPGVADTELLVTLIRILLLQPLLLGVSSLFGVVTQLGHRFILYAVSPLIYNLGIIFGIVALYPFFGLSGLVYGVVIGALGHMCIQLPLVQSSDLAFSLTRTFSSGRLGTILSASIPRALTLSLNQFVLLILVGIAGVMAVGSVSVFQFAFNLQAVPLSIIGVSYSVAAFPILAQLYAKHDLTTFAAHITTALRHIIFWSLPVIALIVVLRAHIVRVLLGSGAFDWSDTRLTAAVLAIFVIALAAQAINLLVIRAFYAASYTRTPLLVTLGGAVISVSLALALYYSYVTAPGFQVQVASLMRLDGVAGSEVLVLAAGYTISTILQTFVFLILLNRTFALSLSKLWRQFTQAGLAALVAAISSYTTLQFVVDGINQDTFLGILIQGVLAGVVGVIGAVLTYAGLRSAELSEVMYAFRRRILKTDVVAPERTML